MWVGKRCRKPKQVGLATADCSVLSIADHVRMAERGEGRLYIVTATSADHARRIIRTYRNTTADEIKTLLMENPDGRLETRAKGRVVAIGVLACEALHGAEFGARHWDGLIESQGRVYLRQSRALTRES
jgi:hypothetical protein